MDSSSRRRKTHKIEISFSDEKVTSFGGLMIEHRLASRLDLWAMLDKRLPERAGQSSWLDLIQSGIAGLLSGARGTAANDPLRDDEALLQMLDLDGAPERMRVKPKRGMRLWRMRRTLFTLPARISRQARVLRVELLGVSTKVRELYERWDEAIARC